VLVKRVLFLLNAALAIAILRLISQVHLPSFVKILPKYLKDSTFSSCFLVYHNFYWQWLFLLIKQTSRSRIFALLAQFKLSHIYVTLTRGRRYENVNVFFNDAHYQGLFFRCWNTHERGCNNRVIEQMELRVVLILWNIFHSSHVNVTKFSCVDKRLTL